MEIHEGNITIDVALNESCVRVKELMSSDYIQLSWNSPTGDALKAGAYVIYGQQKFTLLDDYTPVQTSENSWSYSPQFESEIMGLKKIPFFLYTDDGDSVIREPDWTLTATADYFLDCILKALLNETGKVFKYDFDVTGSKTISFSSADVFSALNSIADSFESEWWYEGRTIHLSKCRSNTELTRLTMQVGQNVGYPSISGDNEENYNRFYAFGSTRNITQSYKGANVNNIASKRLTLNPVKYPNGYYQYSEGDYSKILIFDDIYPAATDLCISDLLVRTDFVLDEQSGEKIPLGTDSAGKTIYDTYAVWYARIQHKDSAGNYTDFNFDASTYNEETNPGGMLIAGLTASVHFSSGQLMGREFEVGYIATEKTFSDTDGTSVTVPAGYFEIKYIKENDYIIPDYAYLTPSVGDNVVLFNIRMPDDYISDAYTRLEQAMMKEIEDRYSADLREYRVSTYADSFDGTVDVGTRVTFIKGTSFDKDRILTSETLDTRVIGYTQRLDFPTSIEIAFGNERRKGVIQQLAESTASANRDLAIISALNETTNSLANAFNRTYQEVAKRLDRLSSMFVEVNVDGGVAIKVNTNYSGLFTDGFLSAKGLDSSAGTVGGSGINESDLWTILQGSGTEKINASHIPDLPYLTSSDLDGYATEEWVEGKGYLTSEAMDGYATESWASEQFLSRLTDDTAAGNITFEQMVKVLGLAALGETHFGEFVKSLYAGKGAGIDALGNAEFESVRVRSYLECLELIINRLSAIEGDQLLTEADTIESVDDLGDSCYGLHLKSKWEGYFTAQAENNVLKGIINTLAAGSGTYYTSWMRVNSVNTANNYIEVTLYPDADTPAGKNYPPCEMMKIARWGNQTDTTRQSCLYLSSTEGRIVKLTGVTKPILDDWNYGTTLGELPEFLKEMDLPIVNGQDYLYARGIVIQDMIRIDYRGKPISDIVDRGLWSASESYYCDGYNAVTGKYETSDVWYMGCKWRCAKTGTTTAPAWNNTDWAMIEGNPAFSVDFMETDYLFDPDNFHPTLTVVAMLYNQDVTADILDADVEWTRYSEDADGNERVSSDNAWAIRRAGSGKSIALTSDDCDFNGYVPKVLRFTATVTLRDGMGEAAATDSVSLEYS